MDVKSHTGYELRGRMNQKRRTRQALKQAAAQLLEAGQRPSVADVARAAAVSKSTAYRYFPSREALVSELILDRAVQTGLDELDAVAGRGTPAERLDATIRRDHELVTHNDAAFRAGLRAMLAPRGDTPTDIPRRPANRLRYLGIAIADLRQPLGEERWHRLLAALSLCVGIESVLVTQDICGLDGAAAESVKRWAAAALLRAAAEPDS